MLGKRTRPAISITKIAGALRCAGIVDSSTSPRSTLDCNNMQSPRSPKYYDQQGGVGLGIVVALNNNNNNKSGGEILAKYTLHGQFSCRSSPIPMIKSSGGTGTDINNKGYEYEVKNESNEEEFTYVTRHGPKKCTSTRVYYNGIEYGHVMGRSNINHNMGVFNISSPTTLFDDRSNDFLSSCHLCNKTLHGKDIYMYRGEKAFCSEECRQKQIRVDEKKEKCRSNNISSSPYSYTTRGGQIFSTGIIAV